MTNRLFRDVLAGFACFSLLVYSGCSSARQKPPEPPPSEVIVDQSITQDVQLYIRTQGDTRASQFVSIPARVAGFLKEIKFKPGDLVQEGQPLFQIESDDYRAALNSLEAELKVNKAKEALAKANFDRSKKLFDLGTVSPEDYQTQTALHQEALGNIDRTNAAIARAKLNLGYTSVVSPLTGKTGPNLVDLGNLVGPGSTKTELVTVAKMDPIHVYFDISDSQFNTILGDSKKAASRNPAVQTLNVSRTVQVGEQTPPDFSVAPILTEFQDPETTVEPPVLGEKKPSVQEFTPANNWSVSPEGRGFSGKFSIAMISGPDASADEGFDFHGTLQLTDNTIDQSTGTIILRGEIPNPDYRIFPGQICRVRIPTDVIPNAVLVREEAVNSDLNTKFLLLVDKDKVVRRRNVKIGELVNGRMRVILAGLKPGETYIYQGIQKAKIDAPVEPLTKEEYEKKHDLLINGNGKGNGNGNGNGKPKPAEGEQAPPAKAEEGAA